MTYFHGDEAKKNQNGRLKKTEFFNMPKAEQFPPKFHGSVLGLVALIDVKGIDVAQLILL